MANIGKNLLELRKQNHLLQNDVAEQLNMSLRNYQRYERGELEPSASIICDLSTFYNVPSDYLLDLGIYAKKELILKYSDYLISLLRNAHGFPEYVKNMLDWLPSQPNYKKIIFFTTLLSDIKEDGDNVNFCWKINIE